MKIHKKLLQIAAYSIAALGFSSAANAANCPAGYPSKAIELWVGYSPGGTTDLLSRSLAAVIAEQQGWQINVINKPGAGSSVMLAALARQKPDGLVIGATTSPSAMSRTPNEKKDSPYTITDFTFLGTAQQLFVGYAALSDRGFTNYKEMIAYAKEKGRLTVASAGSGANFFTDPVAEKEGIKIVIVPTKGAAQAVQQVLGGHVDMAVAGTTHVEHLRAGTMRQIYTLGSARASFADYAPSTKELGYDFAGSNYWWYASTPDGLSAEVQTCLEEALDEAVKTEKFAEVVARSGNKAENIGAKAITELLTGDFVKFKKYFDK